MIGVFQRDIGFNLLGKQNSNQAEWVGSLYRYISQSLSWFGRAMDAGCYNKSPKALHGLTWSKSHSQAQSLMGSRSTSGQLSSTQCLRDPCSFHKHSGISDPFTPSRYMGEKKNREIILDTSHRRMEVTPHCYSHLSATFRQTANVMAKEMGKCCKHVDTVSTNCIVHWLMLTYWLLKYSLLPLENVKGLRHCPFSMFWGKPGHLIQGPSSQSLFQNKISYFSWECKFVWSLWKTAIEVPQKIRSRTTI